MVAKRQVGIRGRGLPGGMRMSLLAVALLATPLAWAGEADGAAVPQEATPAPSAAPQQAQALPEPQMAGAASFVLQGVRFVGVTGATDVPEAELQAAVAGKIGQSVTFSDLEQLAARANAFLEGRDYVLPDDIKAVAPDVMRHRLIVTYQAEAEEVTPESVIAKVLDKVPLP